MGMGRCFVQGDTTRSKHSKAGDDLLYFKGALRDQASNKYDRLDKMPSSLDEMKNAMKLNDWVGLQGIFHKLNKQFGKVTRVSGSVVKAPPTIYLEALVYVGDFLIRAHLANLKEPKNRMNSSDAEVFKAMKLKVTLKSIHYKDAIKKFRENLEGVDYDEIRPICRFRNPENTVGCEFLCIGN